ncbi:MAG: hypothetical protein M1829_003306 [Trizodia sp. TS-e1964]|nr:MAG: hypothetical protein M1829_003306 [Trizodia sp. TS-e1964]
MSDAMVDVNFLSSYLDVPSTSLSTILDAPTAELVQSVLQAIAIRAKEHIEAKAEKVRLEVELENAVRSGEAKSKSLKASIAKGLKDVEELRGKVNEEENARSALETEVQNLKSSSATSTSDVSSLRSRISSLESSNRETLSLLESKSTAHDRLAEELTVQHQKTIELRHQISDLEQSLQSSNAAASNAKFREQTLQQEIELLKKNNEWLETELKTKITEFSKHRKEKGAKISELSRANEDAESNLKALKRSEETLRLRLEEVSKKLDDSFANIQQLKEEGIQAAEDSRRELDAATRLAQLWESSTNTARERVQVVVSAHEQTKEETSEIIGRLQVELESERSQKKSFEQHNTVLEAKVEELETDILTLQSMQAQPMTPRRGINGISTTSLGGSPAHSTPGTARAKPGLNFTQMYSDYVAVKSMLGIETRRSEKLSSDLEEVTRDLAAKAPAIQEMRDDNARLESEILEISAALQAKEKLRDKADRDSKQLKGQVNSLKQEGEILRQQLRDLSTQLRVLLAEDQARKEGLDTLDPIVQAKLEHYARGDAGDEAFEGLSDTGRIISQRLVIYKNVRELQENNTNLCRVIRELGEKMENEEKKLKMERAVGATEFEELKTLRMRVESYKDEIKSMMTKSQSYIRERDMFRRMLQNRGQLPTNSDLSSVFGQSVDGAVPGTPPFARTMSSLENPSKSKGEAESAAMLKGLQQLFDSYKEEASADRQTLKSQNEMLAREKGDLQGEVARSSSQLILAQERLDMLKANFEMLTKENTELQQRSQILAESAAIQDLKTQQAAEELVETKGLVESMRNENANLKAEKKLWGGIQDRLAQDNENLVNERGRLNSMVTSLQSLQNERELLESETRRKLQSRVESLESELLTLKRKLDDEIEDSKKAQIRKEYDAQQHQMRVDDLVSALSSVREELVTVKTTKDHLQARVDELAAELRSSEDREKALQSRLNPQPKVNANHSEVDQTASSEDADQAVQEQELSLVISELRRDLDLSKAELESTKSQVEQYKTISQSSEEELQNLIETHDQYRADIDRIIEERQNQISDLEQKLQLVSSELLTTNAEITSLRMEQAERAKKIEEERTIFSEEVARLKEQEERHSTAAQFHQEDLRAQAEIARTAQQNYENELLKHAEAAKALQKVRMENNEVRTELVDFKTQAEAAKMALNQSEENWKDIKDRYEQEISELRARREDVSTQNKLLHQQLEYLGSQVTSLKQSRADNADSDGDDNLTAGIISDRSIEDLREVIKYLRREKEIVDVQYELQIQESKRVKQQLDHVQSQLDEARLKVEQQNIARDDTERNSTTHKDLLEKLNQLNLFRESNTTLRNQVRAAQEQLSLKAKRVEDLIAQIQPLEAKIRELESGKETTEGEMKILQEDRDRWEQRTQNILQKHDRADPAELESLKSQLKDLENKCNDLEAERVKLQEQADSIPDQVRIAKEESNEQWKTSKDRLVTQFKERSSRLTAENKGKALELEIAVKEKDVLEGQLLIARQELENMKSSREKAIAEVTLLQQQNQRNLENSQRSDILMDGTVGQNQLTPAESEHWAEEKAQLEAKIAAGETLLKEEQIKVKILLQEVADYKSKIENLELQLQSLNQNMADAAIQISRLEPPKQNLNGSGEPEILEEIAKLEMSKVLSDLANTEEELDKVKTQLAIQASNISAAEANGPESTAEQVTERVEALRLELSVRFQERVAAVEAKYNRRAETMKTAVNQRIPSIRSKLEAEKNSALEKLNEEHRKELDSLRQRHREELEIVRKDEEMRFAQEKQIWLEKNATVPAQSAPQTQANASEWTEIQVKDFIANNATIKSIISRNVSNKLAQEKDLLYRRAKEEQEKETAEAVEKIQKKAEIAKAQAVALEGKKFGVKMSMAESKARNALAKIEVVSNAAKETPARPVSEVWEIASVAKPPQIPALAPAQPSQLEPSQRTQQPQAPQNGSIQLSQPPQAVTAGTQQVPVTESSSDPTQGQTQAQSLATTAPSDPASHQKEESSINNSPNFQNSQQSINPGNLNPQPLSQYSNPSLPNKPAPQLVGTGPGALRNLQNINHSAIPRGGTGIPRGSRGRGGQGQAQGHGQGQQYQSAGSNNPHPQSFQSQRGASNLPRGNNTRGRGGPGRGSNQSMNSPVSDRGLNAGAKQFVPTGSKRPRDDGGGDIAFDNKRARGES